MEVLLANHEGRLLKKISLIGDIDLNKSPTRMAYYYPGYYVETVTPFMETSKGLLLAGQSERDLHDSIIKDFKFTASMDFNLNKVDYIHNYPLSLYGNGITWGGGLFTEAFPQLHPDGKNIIYSFPMSHDLYIASIGDNTYKKVYAGSNYASTITSLEKRHKRSNEKIRSSFCKTGYVRGYHL